MKAVFKITLVKTVPGGFLGSGARVDIVGEVRDDADNFVRPLELERGGPTFNLMEGDTITLRAGEIVE